MAKIIKFTPKPLPPLDMTGNVPLSEGIGEVVIFPGIRMERNEFRLSDRIDKDGPVPAPGKRRQPKSNGN